MINPYLDTAIGVAVVYLIFSVLAYVIQELWAAFRESRGRMLQRALYDLLNDPLNKGYGVLLFQHPQFSFLKKSDNKLPAYLPDSNFADAVIDLIGREAVEPVFDNNVSPAMLGGQEGIVNPLDRFGLFSAGIAKMKSSDLKTLLLDILSQSQSVDELKFNLETWFNNYMDRVSGWYKAKIRINLRWIGVSLAIVFNVHALELITSIYSDRQLRDKLVRAGEQIIDQPDMIKSIYESSFEYTLRDMDSVCQSRLRNVTSDSMRFQVIHDCQQQRLVLADSFVAVRKKQFSHLTETIELWELPIGWKRAGQKGSASDAVGRTSPTLNWNFWWWAIGWLLSGLAISSGAPFWFELLNKMINVRRAGIKPKSTTQR